MRGVILAAGDGGRLRPLTQTYPKVLLPMRGRPLISYPLEAMADVGISEVVVVVGYNAQQVMAAVPDLAPPGMRIQFAFNPDFEGGNAISLDAAADFIGDDSFVLCMGDHVIHRKVVARVVRNYAARAVLGVDSAAFLDSQLGDATRVLVDHDGHLMRIGKQLDTWNAVDIGVFRFEPEVFDVVAEMRGRMGVGLELNQLMQHLADTGPGVATCDVEGLFWTDIDTADDYETAGRYLEGADDIGL